MSKVENRRKDFKVYTKKSCEKFNNKYDKRLSRVEREYVQLLPEVAEIANEKFSKTGVFYELDEKATKERLEKVIPKAASEVDSE